MAESSEMLLIFCLIFLTSSFTKVDANSMNVTETEMFSIRVTPQMFNWTEFDPKNQYKFHASLINKPDLPDWLHYIYSMRHQCGFIYGTPPLNHDDTTLQIIALNKDTYETREMTIHLHVMKKMRVAKFMVQIKIDNLNVEDLLDGYRMETLKDIFKKKLWLESADDLYTVFMISAIEVGARLPLQPTEGEGVVLKLGSYKPHSVDLLKLQEEVKPLFKLKTFCPRDFKRTSVERLFRDVQFVLDWCSFRLIEGSNEVPTGDSNLHSNKIVDASNKRQETLLNMEKADIMSEENRWLPPAKYEIPRRSYMQEFLFTIMLPMFVMIVLVSVLSMILCFQHEGITARNQVSDSKGDPSSSRYQNEAGEMTSSDVQNVENFSNKGNLGFSPNNSLPKNPSPNLVVDYNRPQPPPYLGSNTNTLVLRQKPTLDEELAVKRDQARALEESLQLLNEANIINTNFHHHLKEPLFSAADQQRIRFNDELLFDDDNLMDSNESEDVYVAMKPDCELLLRQQLGSAMTNNNDDIMKNLDSF